MVKVGGYGHAPRAPGGPWQTRAVNPYGLWVFVDSNLEYVHDADDRARLREMAKRRLADPEAAIADLGEGLGPEGQTVYAFVTARPPPRGRSPLRTAAAGYPGGHRGAGRGASRPEPALRAAGAGAWRE